jgi:hypothetical protein
MTPEINRNDLDHTLYGLKSMSVLLEDHVAHIWECRDKEAGPKGYFTFVLTEDQWEALDFAASHISDLIREAKKKYYSIAETNDRPARETSDDPA